MKLNRNFHQALIHALELHAEQNRKGGDIPYAAHLFNVCGLVLKAGGSIDQAIAALLHDSLEDQGHQIDAEMLALNYGQKVASIVNLCTDETQAERDSIPWEQRKKNYLNHIQELDEDTLLVMVADKLDNAIDILRELQTLGPCVWEKFTGKRIGMIWYLDALALAFMERKERVPTINPNLSNYISEYKEVVRRIKALDQTLTEKET